MTTTVTLVPAEVRASAKSSPAFLSEHPPLLVSVMTEAQQAALRNFRWASGVTDDSTANGAATSPPSVWSRWTSFTGSYIPLRSDERTNEEEAYFALSRWER